VTAQADRRGGKKYWLCQCDCGKVVEAYTGLLNTGRVKSCGCWTKDRLREKNTLPAGFAARNIILATYKSNATKRGLAWGLSAEDFMRITDSDCHYCGGSPSNRYTHLRKDRSEKLNGAFVYNGIDRMDNSIGYVTENCVPCCDICNKAKRAMDYRDFMNWIQRLTHHQSTLTVGS